MIRQSVKDFYFLLNRFLVLPAWVWTRLRYRTKTGLALHLGCGDDYREGFINADGNFARRKDVWLDLRNPLPFSCGSVAVIYCSHTLEHLFPDEAIRVLKEIFRLLKPGGVARIAVPSLEFALEVMAGKKAKPWPREFKDPKSQAINYLFCDGQHKYAYCFEILNEFANQAGFKAVRNYSAEHGVAPAMYGNLSVGNEPEGSLVVELRKGDRE